MITIALLVDFPEAIPTLAQWFKAQWPEYYAERTLVEIARDFDAEANRDTLPVRLLAFSDAELAGTITLRQHAYHALPQFTPGLGGLFVVGQQRGQGVGTELVRAGMQVARAQGFERLYAVTGMARGILVRLGWTCMQSVADAHAQAGLYSCELP